MRHFLSHVADTVPMHILEAHRATEEMEAARVLMSRWATARADAIRAALAGGMSRTEIAVELGISKQSISRILKRY